MADPSTNDPPRPSTVTKAMWLGYGALALDVMTRIASSLVMPVANVTLFLVALGLPTFLRASLIVFFSRGKSWARWVYVVFWFLGIVPMFSNRGNQLDIKIPEFVLALSWVILAAECAAIVLLFVPASRRWFRAKKPLPAPEVSEIVIRQEVTDERSPTCETCHRKLERFDLGQGARVMVGSAPILFMGVVCSSCGMVQCRTCKGSPSDAPCTRCGSPVRPAYAHYAGVLS